jgi:hypothetical protein
MTSRRRRRRKRHKRKKQKKAQEESPATVPQSPSPKKKQKKCDKSEEPQDNGEQVESEDDGEQVEGGKGPLPSKQYWLLSELQLARTTLQGWIKDRNKPLITEGVFELITHPLVDLEDSQRGKVLVGCVVCKNFYKNKKPDSVQARTFCWADGQGATDDKSTRLLHIYNLHCMRNRRRK